MPAQPLNATVLVLTSEAKEAEQLITALRAGGLTGRGFYTANPERIEVLVERRGCDVVIFLSYDPSLDLDLVLEHCQGLETPVPLVVVADRDRLDETRLKALHGGARDVTVRNDMEHLRFVVTRELADWQTRRQVRTLGRRLQLCGLNSLELARGSPEAVAFLQEGVHVQANEAYLALFRYQGLSDLRAVPFLDLVDSDQRDAVADFLTQREQSGHPGQPPIPIDAIRSDGTGFRGMLHASPGEADGQPGLCLTLRTPEQPRPAEAQVGSPLPIQGSLPGFAALIAELDGRLDASGKPMRPFALFYIRVRGSADLMRDLGLTQGLARIGALATRLGPICGDRGMLMRVNDDGFALIAEDIHDNDAAALADRIRLEAKLPAVRGASAKREIGCDVGYIFPHEGTAYAASGLLDQAFQACNLGGRGVLPVVIHEPLKTASLATRDKQVPEEGDDAMSLKMERALLNDGFILVYQPIVSLMGDTQENYSVLVRMLDEGQRLVEAQDFIGPAIRTGLIEKIDKWAIRQAVRTLAERRSAGQQINFFVNLAEDSFRDPGILIWICDCLRELKVRGSWLTFVFQEELVEANLASLNRLTESLRKIRCRVAINRFGAADSPQNLLQGLSLDFVLLAPDFSQNLADEPDKQQRLQSLAALAREFNVKTVVTGVEDARSLTVLWTAGVDYVQGNFLQRPSPTLDTIG